MQSNSDISDVTAAEGLYKLGEDIHRAKFLGELASLDQMQTMQYLESWNDESGVTAARARASVLLYRFVQLNKQYLFSLDRTTEKVMMEVADDNATVPMKSLVLFLASSGYWVDEALVMSARLNAARITPPEHFKRRVMRNRLLAIGGRRYMLDEDLRVLLAIKKSAFAVFRGLVAQSAPRQATLLLGRERALELLPDHEFLREYLVSSGDVGLLSKRAALDIVDAVSPGNADTIKELIAAVFVAQTYRVRAGLEPRRLAAPTPKAPS